MNENHYCRLQMKIIVVPFALLGRQKNSLGKEFSSNINGLRRKQH